MKLRQMWDTNILGWSDLRHPIVALMGGNR
jgi:hypothetical protein